MTAKTNKQRSAAFKARQREKGLKRAPDIWARPEDHEAILHAANVINERRRVEILSCELQAFNSGVISSGDPVAEKVAKVEHQFDVIRERYAVPPLSSGGEIKATEYIKQPKEKD